jgi:hypothetical protein
MVDAVTALRLILAITVGCWALPCWAAEGTTGAGPIDGVPVAPDGRQVEVLSLGSVVDYDIPEATASVKFKVRSSVFAYNTAMVTTFILGFGEK